MYDSMKSFVITKLIWDDWNVAHIARHDVTPDEVEEVCQGVFHASVTHDERLRTIGITAKRRILTIILARKEAHIYYPITARPASRKERQIYTEWKGGVAA